MYIQVAAYVRGVCPMKKFAYPYRFGVDVKELFSRRHEEDKPILDALDRNQFSLGDKLFLYEQNITIDLELIEHLLTDVIQVINLENSEVSD